MMEERYGLRSGETDGSDPLSRVSHETVSSIAARTGLEPLLTVAELAQLAGQSTRTIARRMAEGTIPATRLGARTIRVSRQAALDYLSGAAKVVQQQVQAELTKEAQS